MNDKRFFDTNILFYAYDTSDPVKQSAAEGLIRQAAADASGVVSTQVLGEFFHATVTRKGFSTPMRRSGRFARSSACRL